MFLDATCCKARVNHPWCPQAVVVATAVADEGHREVLGFEGGDSENAAIRLPGAGDPDRRHPAAAGVTARTGTL
jgi:hypothetical protein